MVAFERSLVAFFLEAADMLGVPKSVAAIYGICFASPEPLSFADIEARLDISKGSISQGLRVLREVGALKVASGTSLSALSPQLSASSARSRELYEPDLKLRKLAAHWIENRLQTQLNAGRTRLQGIVKAVPAGKNGSAKVLKDRVKTLQAWHDQTRKVLPVVKTFLKL
jgi:hypothetical protein